MLTRVTVGAAVLLIPVVLVSGCSSNQGSKNQTSSSSTSGTAASGAETITTQLKTADGTPVANATFDWSDGYATVTVETVAGGILSPGFHGLHIHSVGKCEPDSVAPSGGAPGNFNSAGGHLQVPGHTDHPASGDLTSLEVRSDGSAKLVTTSSSFTKADLSGPEGSALIIHEGADNFANIPPRYSASGKPGPDEQTMSTGDAGERVACAVVAPASASGTSMSTSTSTVTSMTVTAVPAPGGAATTTYTPAPVTTTTAAPGA
ncbi:superoxide dismutase[Cu-Zn] [Candidatus Mycolicibacterium alkanivorans]|uniref:Superoxide dismutase [Cu-Zn] n=1 Tax=Candidatus Mycolicibacterium alkanivorans TaxID=2954114 RepID=A0ABS9YU89_9MYCO|nr:superoxide dismutase family protein [Candidatus Mycolicibacterium alkanivorans]